MSYHIMGVIDLADMAKMLKLRVEVKVSMPIIQSILTSWCSADSADCAFNKGEFETIITALLNWP